MEPFAFSLVSMACQQLQIGQTVFQQQTHAHSSRNRTATDSAASQQGRRSVLRTATLCVCRNISNLDRNVTDIDIKELFQECGELKKCGVRFEPTGGSMGTAFVWFQHPEAAQEAFQKYNNIALDGKPMRIEFDHSEKILTSGVRVGSRSGSGRVVMQAGRLFQNAAEKAQIGGRAARQPGMRSSMRMDMD
ncbi:TPA: hypothetical protein ACH3X2_005088 [Trebouxia sp. C0005]